jgi:ABC-type lipoprotein export system ATPase subunit
MDSLVKQARSLVGLPGADDTRITIVEDASRATPPPPASEPPPTARVTPVSISWANVSYKVTGKTVLHGCSGAASPSEFVALMGPSGAGKSTILDLVAGRIDRYRRGRTVRGRVTLNGKRLTSDGFGRIASYVQQEDALVGILTVRETLFTAARLAGVPTSRVDPIIDRLGLRSAEHTIVGTIFQKGLSGGQKRRLSLAEALITQPSLLLLDEPTSGLDSASALAVVTLLHDLAHRDGCTVVATVHQPASEIWALFDKVREGRGLCACACACLCVRLHVRVRACHALACACARMCVRACECVCVHMFAPCPRLRLPCSRAWRLRVAVTCALLMCGVTRASARM